MDLLIEPCAVHRMPKLGNSQNYQLLFVYNEYEFVAFLMQLLQKRL